MLQHDIHQLSCFVKLYEFRVITTVDLSITFYEIGRNVLTFRVIRYDCLFPLILTLMGMACLTGQHRRLKRD